MRFFMMVGVPLLMAIVNFPYFPNLANIFSATLCGAIGIVGLIFYLRDQEKDTAGRK